MTSIRFAMEGRFGAAAVAIVVAGCIDGLDGRLARLLKATTRFGAIALRRPQLAPPAEESLEPGEELAAA